MLTQAELADQSNLTTAAISNIENGHRRGKWRTHRRLAGALGVPVSELFPETIKSRP